MLWICVSELSRDRVVALTLPEPLKEVVPPTVVALPLSDDNPEVTDVPCACVLDPVWTYVLADCESSTVPNCQLCLGRGGATGAPPFGDGMEEEDAADGGPTA